MFGSQKICPLRLAFAIKTQIRQKPSVSGSGPSFAWLHRTGLVGDASLQPAPLPAALRCVSPKGARHTPGAPGFNPPPAKGSRGPTVAEEGWKGGRLQPRAAGPGNASPGSWLSLEPQWLPASRPQCGGRKKKQLCLAQSLAINQVSISSRSHFTYPKCTRQFLLPRTSPGTLHKVCNFI